MANTSRGKLTFSQASGLEPLPGPLRLGELSSQVRNLVFAVLYDSLEECLEEDDYSTRQHVAGAWRAVVSAKHVFFENQPADEVDHSSTAVVADLKQYCYQAKFNVLFDLLEFICQKLPEGHALARRLNGALKMGRAAYRMNESELYVEPVPTEEEGKAIQRAFEVVTAEEFAGARVHLRNAGKYLGQPGKEADSIRESIHAVEAVCRVIAKEPKATLDEALKVLATKIDLHGAFRKGLGNLYGYTSDEDGIRHSLLESGSATVDLADAQFMLGACASFVSYLVGKARSAGLS